MASCCIGGCDPSSVITASLSFSCCDVHVCGVSRVWRAPRKRRIWIFGNGHMVTMSKFGFDGVSWSLAEFMSFFFSFFQLFSTFFFNFFLYYVRNSDTADNRQHTSSTVCVLQPACYNAIHACRLQTEQEATPHACGSLSALYYCSDFVFNGCFCCQTLRSVGLRVSAAV